MTTYDFIIGYPIILKYDIVDRLSFLTTNVVNNDANNLIQHENALAHSLLGALSSHNNYNTKITTLVSFQKVQLMMVMMYSPIYLRTTLGIWYAYLIPVPLPHFIKSMCAVV